MIDLRFLYAILLTLLPGSELRLGLPVAVKFAIDNNIAVFPIFLLILLINIILIFFVFYFLDNLHATLMNLNFYRKLYEGFLKRYQKKIDKFEKRFAVLGFSALVLIVAIPFPGTGAWSGSLISWILGLDRKKSILAISLGVIIAGITVLYGTLGFLRFLS